MKSVMTGIKLEFLTQEFDGPPGTFSCKHEANAPNTNPDKAARDGDVIALLRQTVPASRACRHSENPKCQSAKRLEFDVAEAWQKSAPVLEDHHFRRAGTFFGMRMKAKKEMSGARNCAFLFA